MSRTIRRHRRRLWRDGKRQYHLLAERGLRELALEQHELGNGFGSSHGLTPIIRNAYFEAPSDVPLLRRAFASWRELQNGLEEPLLHISGRLHVGFAGSHVFEGPPRSCCELDLPHAVLDAAALAARLPGWRDLPTTRERRARCPSPRAPDSAAA